MGATLNFDANEVKPQNGYEAVPAGKYLVAITESGFEDTSSGTGKFLKLVLTILEGEYKDRQLYVRLNLINASEKAVAIARGQLSAICHAIGVLTPKDACELHDLPFVAKAICKKREDTGEINNDVKAFYHKDELNKKDAVQAPTAAAGKTAPTTAPWKK